jgi:hypothetical protein
MFANRLVGNYAPIISAYRQRKADLFWGDAIVRWLGGRTTCIYAKWNT